VPGSAVRSRDLGRRPRRGSTPAERTWPVWAAIAGAPLLWAAALGGSYVLVPVSCDLGSALPLHALRLVTAAGAAATAYGAWGVWQATRGTQALPLRRAAFLALLGVGIAAFSTLLIVLEGVANFVVSPCR